MTDIDDEIAALRELKEGVDYAACALYGLCKAARAQNPDHLLIPAMSKLIDDLDAYQDHLSDEIGRLERLTPHELEEELEEWEEWEEWEPPPHD